uniref:Uncharacterized protein n=1 Tax=Siphoviridae sp. ctCfI1 TaxID=2827809 RepID=A0A8S5SSM0_9CAUD|nr:MAG TPA: hypothetical protein [Siphoviridae sp. ctCfI1]
MIYHFRRKKLNKVLTVVSMWLLLFLATKRPTTFAVGLLFYWYQWSDSNRHAFKGNGF